MPDIFGRLSQQVINGTTTIQPLRISHLTLLPKSNLSLPDEPSHQLHSASGIQVTQGSHQRGRGSFPEPLIADGSQFQTLRLPSLRQIGKMAIDQATEARPLREKELDSVMATGNQKETNEELMNAMSSRDSETALTSSAASMTPGRSTVDSIALSVDTTGGGVPAARQASVNPFNKVQTLEKTTAVDHQAETETALSTSSSQSVLRETLNTPPESVPLIALPVSLVEEVTVQPIGSDEENFRHGETTSDPRHQMNHVHKPGQDSSQDVQERRAKTYAPRSANVQEQTNVVSDVKIHSDQQDLTDPDVRNRFQHQTFDSVSQPIGVSEISTFPTAVNSGADAVANTHAPLPVKSENEIAPRLQRSFVQVNEGQAEMATVPAVADATVNTHVPLPVKSENEIAPRLQRSFVQANEGQAEIATVPTVADAVVNTYAPLPVKSENEIAPFLQRSFVQASAGQAELATVPAVADAVANTHAPLSVKSENEIAPRLQRLFVQANEGQAEIATAGTVADATVNTHAPLSVKSENEIAPRLQRSFVQASAGQAEIASASKDDVELSHVAGDNLVQRKSVVAPSISPLTPTTPSTARTDRAKSHAVIANSASQLTQQTSIPLMPAEMQPLPITNNRAMEEQFTAPPTTRSASQWEEQPVARQSVPITKSSETVQQRIAAGELNQTSITPRLQPSLPAANQLLNGEHIRTRVESLPQQTIDSTSPHWQEPLVGSREFKAMVEEPIMVTSETTLAQSTNRLSPTHSQWNPSALDAVVLPSVFVNAAQDRGFNIAAPATAEKQVDAHAQPLPEIVALQTDKYDRPHIQPVLSTPRERFAEQEVAQIATTLQKRTQIEDSPESNLHDDSVQVTRQSAIRNLSAALKASSQLATAETVQPQAMAMTTSRRQPQQSAPEPIPTIHVTIGRVVVQSVAEPARPTVTQRGTTQPPLSLDAYLQQRTRGAR